MFTAVYQRRIGFAAHAVTGLLLATAPAVGAWEDDWEAAPDFKLSVDTAGYAFPSSIAFVPNPGPAPNDPLYFVTELRGAVKVVTRDRTVHVFAKDFFTLDEMPTRADSARRGTLSGPHARLPEMGMAGITLDPEHGYVFVSFTYNRADGQIKNNIVRFTTRPESFAVAPTGKLEFTEVFANQAGDDSHMIGPMAVHEGQLYVNVGDAQTPVVSRSLDSTSGKILRMTLEGKPVSENPFYRDDTITDARNFVWAKGFRNPFGLRFVQGHVFVTDVGPNVDRFVRVEEGRDYGYDGSDWSISSHADIAFAPSVSPVQFVYHPAKGGPFPEDLADRFYVVTSGDQSQPGPSQHGDKALLSFAYDFEHRSVIDRPVQILGYRKADHVMPVGLGLGPDGLYIASLTPNRDRTTEIIKVTYEPGYRHRHVIEPAAELIQSYGCYGCHRPEKGAPAPPLDKETLVSRVLARLGSAEYEAESLALDQHSDPAIRERAAARAAVRDARGIEKARLWIKNRIVDPKFDNPSALMPKLGLTDDQAQKIADHLTQGEKTGALEPIKAFISRKIPKPRQRHLFLFLGAGMVLGVAVALLGVGAFIRLRRRMVRRRAERAKSADPGAHATAMGDPTSS